MDILDFFDDFDTSTAYNSEGAPLTTGQNAFFKDSKCVDDSGNLLVLYRASNSNYNTFNPDKIGTSHGAIFGKGFYFSDDPYNITIYGKNIRQFYLNLKNPFRWEMVYTDEDGISNLNRFIDVLTQNNFKVTEDLRRRLKEDLLEDDGGLDTAIELSCGIDRIQDYFMRVGYDGIMNLQVGDYVAFQPEQIKLCTNKNPTESSNISESAYKKFRKA